jgi:hypothetical protein
LPSGKACSTFAMFAEPIRQAIGTPIALREYRRGAAAGGQERAGAGTERARNRKESISFLFPREGAGHGNLPPFFVSCRHARVLPFRKACRVAADWHAAFAAEVGGRINWPAGPGARVPKRGMGFQIREDIRGGQS